MSINALVHQVTVIDKATFETADQLKDMLDQRAVETQEFDETYVLEEVKERLSDGSYKYSLRIRLAEPV